MNCSGGICLLSIFVFILCLSNSLSNQQRLNNYGSGLYNSSKTVNGSIINKRRLRIPYYANGRFRNVIPTTATLAAVSVTRRTDDERNMRTQTEWRDESKSAKYGFVFTTGRPFPQGSSGSNSGVNVTISPNKFIRVNGSANTTHQRFKDFDTISGTTYLCFSNAICERYLGKSTCADGRCICLYPYVYDGQKCREPGDIRNCFSHKDCSYIQDGRCVLVTAAKTRICMCGRGLVFDVYRCLPKVEYLGVCVSDKQCPSDVPCTKGICRSECQFGYIWKFNRCIKDIPTIIPTFIPYSKNVKSVIMLPTVLFGIVGGISLFVLFLTTVIIIRRYVRGHTNQQSSATNIADSPRTLRSPSITQPSYGSAEDQPPSYDEVMTASTLTLPTNAEGMNNDLPPSYKSWEEVQHIYSTLPR